MDIEAWDQSRMMVETARLLADTSRATIMLRLLDGRAYTANELAWASNVSPQTASFHLGKLGKANLVQFTSQGRHRYFRLAGSDVGQVLETVLALHSFPAPKMISTTCPPELRTARYCYDHLAGRLGVSIYRAMLSNGWVAADGRHLVATAAASATLERLGIRDAPSELRAKPCLDWSEREFHLAGSLGKVLAAAMLAKRWLLRGEARALTITEEGRRRLSSLGLVQSAFKGEC